uniref:Uncharacterized protein n=1 Tax=Eptatretus burgeri TaxID=7764 RepID=A0A8C4Q7V4_EPTBU
MTGSCKASCRSVATHFVPNLTLSFCSISESFFTVKGAALFLPRGNGTSSPRTGHRRSKHAGTYSTCSSLHLFHFF